jgi:HEAT repeat protein
MQRFLPGKSVPRFLRLLCTLSLSLSAPLFAQTQTPPSSLPSLLSEVVSRANSGNNSSAFDAVMQLAEAIGKAPLSDIKEVLPEILNAMDDKKPAVRTLALTALVAVENRPSNDALPLLEPELPRIAAHLTDEDHSIRSATTTVLGGFLNKPPDTIFPPLIAYLSRPDAISTVGSSVVFDLVRLGPQRPDVIAAVTAFINRGDQTQSCLINSIDAIAHAASQSEAINLTLLHHLDSPNPAIRIALIRDLPELELSPATFTTTQSRLRVIASDEKEPEAVRLAASVVLPCWVNDRHQPCPAFSLPSPGTAEHDDSDEL